MPERIRPDREHYFMGVAIAVRQRANCKGQRVGAIIVKDSHIISTGYNGTPADMPNCEEENGCFRCSNRERFVSGTGYDLCICVHAEQNALLSAARFGIAVEGATLYTTTRPCFGCTKEMLQARIHNVYFIHDWVYPSDEVRHEYQRLQTKLPGGIKRLEFDDADAAWATAGKSLPPEGIGH